jgi:hypothetical protein
MRYELSESRARLEIVKRQGFPTEIAQNLGDRPLDVEDVCPPIRSPADLFCRLSKELARLHCRYILVFRISISPGLL